MRNIILFLLIMFMGGFAKADLLLDIGATYSGDTLNTTSNSNATQYFYNVSTLFSIDRKAQWNAGFAVLGISQAGSNAGVNSTYSSFDLGPAFRWNIDKGGIFSLAAAYGYLAKGNYSNGSTSETWEGTSIFGQFSVQAPLHDEKFFIGFSVNYYSANYTKKVVGNVESSNGAQKNWVFPMLSMTWRP